MMTSSTGQREAYVWLHLPDQPQPVVCGRVAMRRAGPDSIAEFTYGRSYRERDDAIALVPHGLPVDAGVQPSRRGLHGVLRDAAPDAWGRRVLLHRLGLSDTRADAQLTEIDYLLTGADRPGALHFQAHAEHFDPPQPPPRVSLDALAAGVLAVEHNQPLDDELLAALAHGTSIGGARPKALVEHSSSRYIVKFSSSGDVHPMIALEFAAMTLAGHCGLNAAATRFIQAGGRDAMLIERFDQSPGDSAATRRHFFSALTALELDEMEARYAGYPLLADYLRRHAGDPVAECRTLFERMVFNILIGNTDDHARNHALFWNGREVSLTPAYDLCIWPRVGGGASQAMDVGRHGKRASIENALSQCERFGLAHDDALQRCRRLADCIGDHWSDACDQAGLPDTLHDQLLGTAVLAPSALTGLG